jgi:hypothetical protein
MQAHAGFGTRECISAGRRWCTRPMVLSDWGGPKAPKWCIAGVPTLRRLAGARSGSPGFSRNSSGFVRMDGPAQNITHKLHRAHRKDLDPDGGSLRGFLASLRERDRLLGRPVAAAGACSLRPTTWCAVRSCCPTRYGCSRQPGTIASRYTYSWTASGAARCMASCRPRLTAAKTPRAIQPRTVERETLAASVIRRSPGASSAVFTRALIDFSVLALRVLSPRLYLR